MFWNSLAFLLFLLHHFLQLIQPEPLQQNLLIKLGSNKYCFSHQPYLLVNAQFDQHFVTKANLNVKNKYKVNIWIDEINIKQFSKPHQSFKLNYRKPPGVVILLWLFCALFICLKKLWHYVHQWFEKLTPLSYSNMQVCAKMCFFKHVCCLYMSNSVSC